MLMEDMRKKTFELIDFHVGLYNEFSDDYRMQGIQRHGLSCVLHFARALNLITYDELKEYWKYGVTLENYDDLGF